MEQRWVQLAMGLLVALLGTVHVAPAQSCAGKSDGMTCDAGTDAAQTLICVGGTCRPCTADLSAAPRFVDNLDGTITDRETCLVWEKKDNAGGIHDLNNLYDWNSAATVFLPLLNNPASPFAGHKDWRLPTAAGRPGSLTGQPAEIESIQASPSGCGGTPGGGCVATAFDTMCGPYGDVPPDYATFTTSHAGCTVDGSGGPPCSCTPPYHYWSASSVSGAPGTAWLECYTVAAPTNGLSSPDLSSTYDVRAVRGGVAAPQVSVLTSHNDNGRTGQNLQETILTASNVNRTQFGKLFRQVVDGYVYAQPLYVPGVTIPNKGTHNVVYVATEHDSVYAFDADDRTGSNKAPLWKASFLHRGVQTVPSKDTGAHDIVPEMGITGTPVIDANSGTLYVVANTKEYQGHSHTYVYRLHALDITSGAEKFGGPAMITASVSGTGDGGTVDVLDPLRHLQRPGLLLVNGVVYVAFGSHGDIGTYHGWVIGYDAATLQQVAVFNVTPNGAQGAIWQSGAGPAADAAGNIYFETGNGDFDANTAGSDFGDSFVKLSTSGVSTNPDTLSTLPVADYFTPYNQASLNSADLDLGSGAPLLLPDQPGASPHLVVGSGKDGTIYLVDRDSMGEFNNNGMSDNQIVQSLPTAIGGTWSIAAYWSNGTANMVYYNGSGDVLRAFQLVPPPGLDPTRTQLLQVAAADTAFAFPGATPSISANGTTNGIVWTLQTDSVQRGDASYPRGSAVLHAYDANSLTELYNSKQARGRDNPGGAVKFTVPTIANGKVYVGTRHRLAVFGLL